LITKIIKCRLCNSKKLKLIINFNKVPLGNNLQNKLVKSLSVNSYSLSLNNCQKCGHYQLGYSVNKKILYATNYTYLSGITSSFQDHFKNYSKKIIKKTNLKKGSLILDIGSNDGSCLVFFKKLKMNVLGIDPAKKPANIANKKGIKTINRFFDKKNSILIKKKYGEVDFITSHNVFAHVENFQELIKNTQLVLKKNGYLCFEVGYFKEVLKNNYFDTIYHEHLDYHHGRPVVKCLNSFGYSVVKISINKIQGGSIRILCKNDKKGINSKNVYNFLEKERKSIYFKDVYLKNWKNNIERDMKKITTFIKNNIKNNKLVIGYGAPTKATLILKILKMDRNTLKNTIEDNHLKTNKYLPVTGIPIFESKYLKDINPDIILILAWNFKNEILQKLKSMGIKQKTIIVPLPKFEIIEI